MNPGISSPPQFEFLEYVATPGEKHFGIATIKAYGKVILSYKIIPGKDGKGYFVGCASYKIPGIDTDTYMAAHMIDSNFEQKQVNNLIMGNVKKFLITETVTPIASVFDNFMKDEPIAEEHENSIF